MSHLFCGMSTKVSFVDVLGMMCCGSTDCFDHCDRAMVWYGMVWYGMVWYGMVWYGMVWYCIISCAMVTYGMVLCGVM